MTHEIDGLKVTNRELLALYAHLDKAGHMPRIATNRALRHDEVSIAWARDKSGNYRVLAVRSKGEQL